MGKRIKAHQPDFKFKVVLESFVQGNVVSIARSYGVNANQLSTWRKLFVEKGPMIYQTEKANREKVLEKQLVSLEQLIGQKEIEISLLKKYLDFYSPPDGK